MGTSYRSEESILPSDGIESCGGNGRIKRVDGDYIAIPREARPTTDASAEQESLGLQVETRNLALLVTVCCVGAAVLAIGAFASYNVIARHGTIVIDVMMKNDGENEFFQAEKTAFHFQPSENWMNDPNGPLFYMGYYHLFYQWNPHSPVWGDIVWGHAVSTDLVHWTYLEVALERSEWYDRRGVWSGSATILKDGTPALLYTGVREGGDDGYIQTQNLALPVDPTDPLLRKWRKAETNPIIINPENIRPQDFRDPTTAWLEQDGLWRIVVGAKSDNPDGTEDGFALLYTSSDFEHWDNDGQVLHEVPGTGMWECVDFFPVLARGKAGLNHSVLQAENYVDTFKYVLKASVQDTAHDEYAIGEYSLLTHKFTPDDAALDVGLGYRYDYGKFYASKTFFDTKTSRRILWAWVNESDSEQDDIVKGWSSVMAVPRVLWLDGLTNTNLLQWPVEEVDLLRGSKSTQKNILLEPAKVLKIEGGDGPQLDILVEFEKPDISNGNGTKPEADDFDCSQGGSAHRGMFGPFGLLVLTDDDLTEQTAVFFYVSLMHDGHWATKVCSDQSRSSKAPGLDKTVFGTYVTVLPTESTLTLRVLVDHSIVETFVQGGRLAITSRVYPTVALNAKSHLFVFNNGTADVRLKSIDVYQMNAVDMTSLAEI